MNFSAKTEKIKQDFRVQSTKLLQKVFWIQGSWKNTQSPDNRFYRQITTSSKAKCPKSPYYIGRGQLGYLALAIDPTTYNSIPISTNFTRLTDPDTFTPTNLIWVRADPLMAVEIATQKIMFNETKYRYNECQGVKVSLLNQI